MSVKKIISSTILILTTLVETNGQGERGAFTGGNGGGAVGWSSLDVGSVALLARSLV